VVVTPLPITFFTATLVWKDPSSRALKPEEIAGRDYVLDYVDSRLIVRKPLTSP
jgi:hypothetical protein